MGVPRTYYVNVFTAYTVVHYFTKSWQLATLRRNCPEAIILLELTINGETHSRLNRVSPLCCILSNRFQLELIVIKGRRGREWLQQLHIHRGTLGWVKEVSCRSLWRVKGKRGRRMRSVVRKYRKWSKRKRQQQKSAEVRVWGSKARLQWCQGGKNLREKQRMRSR